MKSNSNSEYEVKNGVKFEEDISKKIYLNSKDDVKIEVKSQENVKRKSIQTLRMK
jgi:hypothetical protein